ncbi:hypothetical protein OG909_22880 [Streptomyces sp. NBC_01754]|uniref:hypothetical protein n=1 Tax=Streptomyces sp. NBC_01754 TaxID=2975930 RepID=UPI002DD889DD|nr:hypothetical protein [Streptomyces sp. NBC_01754]WSC94892.1 hypothetical protein OG909_22880 [Streptomyces sp. NBC_01754]
MRGDETQPDAAGDGTRTGGGPRHAAPRKSLLTKLHLPSGKKAFALAAMPTAVFVGMGLTPRLALADDNPDIPFAPGPCVTRSDEPSESREPEATPAPSPTPTGDTGEDGQDDRPGTGGTQAPKPTGSPSAQESPGAFAQKTGSAAKKAEATPTPTESTNPLDPLGVGDALRDFFHIPAKETAIPSPSTTTGPPDEAEDEAPAPAKEAKDPAKDDGDPARDAADKTADAIREAAGQAGRDVEELDEDVKGLDPVKDEDVPDGAKPRFPCPVPDPDALAAAGQEQGVPLLPTDPWILESSLLTLNGLDYKGIVEVRTGDGGTKKVLKFTAKSVDIKDLHQLTTGPVGTTGHVKARGGSTSTIRDGQVTMYTEELKGNLFGLIPITFSPETPPPLNVPFAFFTKVRVVQAGQFGGTLKVPGLQNYFTGGNG